MFKKILGFLLLTLVNFYDTRAMAETGICFVEFAPQNQWGNLGTPMDEICSNWCHESSCLYAALSSSSSCAGVLYCYCSSCYTTGGGTGDGNTDNNGNNGNTGNTNTATCTACTGSAENGNLALFYMGCHNAAGACVPSVYAVGCRSGYYGMNTVNNITAAAINNAVNALNGNCVQCPTMAGKYTTYSASGGQNAAVTSCYMASNKDYVDVTGTFVFESNCYHN